MLSAISMTISSADLSLTLAAAALFACLLESRSGFLPEAELMRLPNRKRVGRSSAKSAQHASGKETEVEDSRDSEHQCQSNTGRQLRRLPGRVPFAKEHDDYQPQVIVGRKSAVQDTNHDQPDVTLAHGCREHHYFSHKARC